MTSVQKNPVVEVRYTTNDQATFNSNTISTLQQKNVAGPKNFNKFDITQFQRRLKKMHEQTAWPKGLEEREIEYDDKGKFKGTFYNGKREGLGSYTFPNGDFYKGLWRNDQFSGLGYYKYSQHRKAYIGQFQNGKHHGQGSLVLDDNTSPIVIYEGNWEHGLKHGRGTYFYYPEPQEYYEGSWDHGQKSGQGVYYKNGAYYAGQWLNNQRNGQGSFTTKDNVVYSGVWKDNKLDRGTVQYPKQVQGNPSKTVYDKYEGELQSGLRHGQGVYTYADGGYYKGSYVKDQRSGLGLEVRDKSQYEGSFLANKKHGKGVFKFASGDEYQGMFVEGRKQGPNAVYVWADGSKFVGVFQQDNMWEGIYRDIKDGIQRKVSKGQVLAI